MGRRGILLPHRTIKFDVLPPTRESALTCKDGLPVLEQPFNPHVTMYSARSRDVPGNGQFVHSHVRKAIERYASENGQPKRVVRGVELWRHDSRSHVTFKEVNFTEYV